MVPVRHKPIPLPCALLALSVAVSIGLAGPMEASVLRSVSATQADQRETIEHLLGAIQQAAKKLSDQLSGQVAAFNRQGELPATAAHAVAPLAPGDEVRVVLFLREALLNLPPPVC